MDNEREKREPTDAEKALFDRIVDGMLYKGGVIEELSVPKAAFRTWCLAVIMQYTDWLRPEPTADDRETAEDLAIAFVDLCEKENCRLHRIDTIAPAIEAALSAARGNRAELEAAAREGLNPVCNVCDRGREGHCHSGCGWFNLRQLLAPPSGEKG